RLHGNPAQIEKKQAWHSDVLEPKYQPAGALDEAPQAELKPLSGGKPMADIAL
ncbi:MAG TPA: malate:quinone oxidoreductase, partial [Klebsiella pneumoniae]|nr:malate:quinone oxidoreductase [Klebsiella pneumoniae]